MKPDLGILSSAAVNSVRRLPPVRVDLGATRTRSPHGTTSSAGPKDREPRLPRIEALNETSSRAASWLRQWRAAGPALEEVRRRELRDLSDEEALAATEDLLSMAQMSPLPPERLAWSGLVTQQALLHRRRTR